MSLRATPNCISLLLLNGEPTDTANIQRVSSRKRASVLGSGGRRAVVACILHQQHADVERGLLCSATALSTHGDFLAASRSLLES